MSRNCLKCGSLAGAGTRYGFFVRRSDKLTIQRYKCRTCGTVFSQSTFQSCYRQKKRKLNPRVLELLCSGVSQRRIARLLRVNRKTVVRKLVFLSRELVEFNLKKFKSLNDVTHFQFDDLETIEHTKLKPLSVTMAVEQTTRRILGFTVSQMPAKGHLAQMALKKYGYRIDKRAFGRKELFKKIAPKIAPGALIQSDQNPHYVNDVKEHFPTATHIAFLGQRGSVSGQGELKKVRYDPLFSLNHTYAMLRANINRLFRKTWCTTKRPDRLQAHIELYTYYHNEVLLKAS